MVYPLGQIGMRSESIRITRRLINKEVVVQGNTRVYKALRNNLADVLKELQRIENGGEVNDELLDLIEMIADILGGLRRYPSWQKNANLILKR